jgi:hypothetical protein
VAPAEPPVAAAPGEQRALAAPVGPLALAAPAAPGVISDVGASGSTPLAGATVQVLGASPANMTTSAANGTYTLMIASGTTVFIRADASAHVSAQSGLVVPGTAVSGFDLGMPSTTLFGVLAGILSYTVDAAKGVVIVFFQGNGLGNDAFGATLSAAHDPPFTIHNSAPSRSTTANAGDPLGFPNTVAGTTTVTAVPPSGRTCTPAQAITDHRVDPGIITIVNFNCQ